MASTPNQRKAPRYPIDPFLAFRFNVSVMGLNGIAVAGGFSDVTGLSVDTEVEPLRVGGMNEAEYMLPGPTKFPSRLVLKKGIGHPAVLWAWYLSIMKGAILRANITVEMTSPDDRPTRRWTFKDACPVKWMGPEFRAGTAAVAFETIELIHKGFLAPEA